MHPRLSERIGRLAREAFGRCPQGGILAGLVCGGDGLVWSQAVGYAHTEEKRAATPATRYRIGSITKRITGIMLHQLVERGVVGLDDPLISHFPEFRQVSGRYPSFRPTTLRQLALHRSGLMRDALLPAAAFRGGVASWEQALLSTLPFTHFAREPDQRFAYSNCGYALLGAALARAAKRPYVEYVREEILVPLGMFSTSFEPGPPPRDDLARGYQVSGETVATQLVEQLHEGRGYRVPQGGLYSTLADLARWAAFEMGHAHPWVLGERERLASRGALAPHTACGPGWYGSGLFGRSVGDSHLLWHGGNVAGYDAAFGFEPKSETAIIVLRNVSERARAREILFASFGIGGAEEPGSEENG